MSVPAVIEYVLRDPARLSVGELGRLSCVAKWTALEVAASGAWEAIFKAHAALGAEWLPASRHAIESKMDYPLYSWCGEKGLLPCFASPSPSVIARTGWAAACRCLLSRRCYQCGAASNRANPVAMLRACGKCAAANEAAFLILKSGAMHSFLLTDKDLKDLPSASFESIQIGKKIGHSQVLLMSDVVAAAFTKWGGADGLEAAIRERKSAAKVRYDKSQGTDKPQKKRSKIEHQSERPADKLANLRCSYGAQLTTGTYNGSCRAAQLPVRQGLGFARSIECSVRGCDVAGLRDDVVMHSRLVHDIFPTEEKPWSYTSEPTNLVISTALAADPGLMQLLNTGASARHARTSQSMDGYIDFVEIRDYCTVSLGKDAKVALDFAHSDGDEAYYDMSIWAALGNAPPRKLLQLAFMVPNEGFHAPPYEVCTDNFLALVEDLGLQQESAVPLLALLLAQSYKLCRSIMRTVMDFILMPAENEAYFDNEACGGWLDHGGPILGAAFDLLFDDGGGLKEKLEPLGAETDANK